MLPTNHAHGREGWGVVPAGCEGKPADFVGVLPHPGPLPLGEGRRFTPLPVKVRARLQDGGRTAPSPSGRGMG